MKMFIYSMLTLLCSAQVVSAADENKTNPKYEALAYSPAQPSQPIDIPAKKIISQPMYSVGSSYSPTPSASSYMNQTGTYPSSQPWAIRRPTDSKSCASAYAYLNNSTTQSRQPSAPPSYNEACPAETCPALAQKDSAPITSYGACMPARSSEHIPGPEAPISSLVDELTAVLNKIPPAHRVKHVKTLLETLTDDGNLEVAATAVTRGTKTGNGQQADFRNLTDKNVLSSIKTIVTALRKAHAIEKK